MEGVLQTPSTKPSSGDRRICLLSGASGYVGSSLKARLTAEGWKVMELGRSSNPRGEAISFQLGETVNDERLKGCFGLIHCAYDFSELSWSDIWARNVRGSELLLRCAREAGVRRLVYISSISAFEGCQSLYGKAKLEIEGIARSLNAWIIRPGLVYGDKPGAAFGSLVESVRRSTVLPIPGSGKQSMYLVHEDDLAQAVLRSLELDRSPSPIPVTVANEQPWSFRSILEEIAKSLGRKSTFVPIPWRLMWAGLQVAEGLRIPIGLRSDSVISLVHQNPKPLFNSHELLGVKCRPFELSPRVACSK